MGETNLVEQKLPFGKNLVFAIQHVFVMVAGAVAVPMIVGGAAGVDSDITFLVSCALFVAGIATLLQTLGVGKFLGAKIPVIEGTSFASVATMVALATGKGELGMRQIAGGVIAAGLFCFLMAGVWSKLLKFFPHIVTGTVVTVIGVSLFPVGIRWITDRPTGVPANATPDLLEKLAQPGALPEYLIIAGITLLIVIFCNKFLKGIWNNISILLAIAGGTIITLIRDMLKAGDIAAGTAFPIMDLQPIRDAKWVGLVTPFKYGAPKFEFGIIISFILVMLVIMTEATGNMIAVHNMAGKELDPKNLSRGLRSSGLGTMISGAFNSYPVTPFGQNVGMLTMTQQYSRFITATSGIILVLLAFFPKFGAIFAAIPKPVLGGVSFTMFGVVAVNGIRTLGKVNYNGNKNALIVAISLGLSLIPTVNGQFFNFLPEAVGSILHSGITIGCISAIVLNIIFNMLFLTKEQKEQLKKDHENEK